ncbi:MAG: PEP-CTERM sorting domain-containing protein [Thermoguttaceae bacterium]
MSNNKLRAVLGGLAACLWCAVSSAQVGSPITAFGLSYSPVGNATVALATAGTGVVVGNLGSAGQDGVSIGLSGAQGTAQTQSFSLDTSLDLGGTPPTGAFLKQTAMASTLGGTNQLVSTITATQLAGGSTSVAADFTPVSNAPLTIDYFSGGPNGTLVYSEQAPGAGVATVSCIPPGNTVVSIYGDNNGSWYQFWKWTGGVDGNLGAVTTAGGTVLPAGDNINFIDFLATPTASGAALGPYSSFNLTAGGGISSFTVSGETVATPEPSTLALLGVGAIGLLGLAWRRRRRAA